MDIKAINNRMVEIKKAIDENLAKRDQCIADQKKIEDMLILQNGALQECAFWLKVCQGEDTEELEPVELQEMIKQGEENNG